MLHRHAALVGALVAPMILLILAAFPTSSAVYLTQKRRNGLLDTIAVREKFGFMYAAYTDECVFWDSVIMLRKASLALVLIFGTSLRSNVQGLTALLILILSLYLQMQYTPYRNEYETFNALEVFSLLVCIFIFMSGLFFNDPSVSEAGRMVVSVAAVVLICGFVFYFLYNLYLKAAKYCRLTLVRDGETIRAEDTRFTIISKWLRFRLKRAIAQNAATVN